MARWMICLAALAVATTAWAGDREVVPIGPALVAPGGMQTSAASQPILGPPPADDAIVAAEPLETIPTPQATPVPAPAPVPGSPRIVPTPPPAAWPGAYGYSASGGAYRYPPAPLVPGGFTFATGGGIGPRVQVHLDRRFGSTVAVSGIPFVPGGISVYRRPSTMATPTPIDIARSSSAQSWSTARPNDASWPPLDVSPTVPGIETIPTPQPEASLPSDRGSPATMSTLESWSRATARPASIAQPSGPREF